MRYSKVPLRREHVINGALVVLVQATLPLPSALCVRLVALPAFPVLVRYVIFTNITPTDLENV